MRLSGLPVEESNFTTLGDQHIPRPWVAVLKDERKFTQSLFDRIDLAFHENTLFWCEAINL